MLWPRIYRNTKLIVYLNCSYEEFKAIAKEAYVTNNYQHLLKEWEPMVEHWYKCLINRDVEDLFYASFRLNLSRREKTLNRYLENNNESEIKQDLRIVFFNTVRKLRFFPNFAKPHNFIFLLFNKFKFDFTWHVYKSFKPEGYSHEDIIVYQPDIDYLVIKQIQKDPWLNYLYILRQNGYVQRDITNLTSIPRETFKYEDLKLCHKLNMI